MPLPLWIWISLAETLMLVWVLWISVNKYRKMINYLSSCSNFKLIYDSSDYQDTREVRLHCSQPFWVHWTPLSRLPFLSIQCSFKSPKSLNPWAPEKVVQNSVSTRGLDLRQWFSVEQLTWVVFIVCYFKYVVGFAKGGVGSEPIKLWQRSLLCLVRWTVLLSHRHAAGN